MKRAQIVNERKSKMNVLDHSPKEVNFALPDPKHVEFTCHAKLPHLEAHVIHGPECGSALLKTSNGAVVRLQVPFRSDAEIEEIVEAAIVHHPDGGRILNPKANRKPTVTRLF